MLLDATVPCQLSEACPELTLSAHLAPWVNDGADGSTTELCSVTQQPQRCSASLTHLDSAVWWGEGRSCVTAACSFPKRCFQLVPVVRMQPVPLGLHPLRAVPACHPGPGSSLRPTCSAVGSATPSLRTPGPPGKAAGPSCALAGGLGPHIPPMQNWLWLS